MYGSSLASASRRFLRKSGFALFQASMLGAVVGALVFFRLPSGMRPEDGAERAWHESLRLWLDGWERVSYDWRARELGKLSSRPDGVVLVAVDDDTIASARNDERPGVDIQPWPRELLGGLVDRLFAEGAALVLVNPLFPDASPAACSRLGLAPGEPSSDDEAFRTLLERHPEGTVLAFSWREARARPGARAPKSYLLRVADESSRPACREWVRRIVSEKKPAFVIPDGPRLGVWAGVSSQDEARQLARSWELGEGPTLRDLTPAERVFETSVVDLLTQMAEVQVDGLNANELPRAGALVQPVPQLLSDRVFFGSVRPSPDADGKVRGLHHLVNYLSPDGKSHVLPSAPLVAAMRLAGTRELRYRTGRLWVGDRFSVPMNEHGFSLVRFDAPEAPRDGRGGLARALSAWHLLVNLFDQRQGAPAHYRNDLENRVAVLANTATGSGERWSTPIGRVSGGGFQGQALANLLRSEGVARADPRFDFMSTVAMAFLGALASLLLGASFRSLTGLLASALAVLVLLAGYLWVARHLFIANQLWVAVAGPALAMAASFVFTTAYAVRTERRILDFVLSALGRSVSPEVARKVSSNLSLMRPERRQVSVYFSDIEGFSRMAEQLTPSQLADLLNEYLSEMTQVVHKNGGQVDKYIGDTVSAFWGAPLKIARHADRACEAAIQMREALARRRADWERRYKLRLEFRAGVNTGEAVVGDMGTQLQSNYTVLGDVVGFASRLERENRYYGTFILAGETTVRETAGRFMFREVDRIRLRGKDAPTVLYELLGRAADGPPNPRAHAVYQRALEAYYGRRFLEALELFSSLGGEDADPLAALYVKRCDHYLDNAPPEDWDGVFELAAR